MAAEDDGREALKKYMGELARENDKTGKEIEDL